MLITNKIFLTKKGVVFTTPFFCIINHYDKYSFLHVKQIMNFD